MTAQSDLIYSSVFQADPNYNLMTSNRISALSNKERLVWYG